MFDRKGVLVIDRKESMDDDEMMMMALEAGAEDISSEETHFEIYTTIEDFGTVRDAISAQGYEFTMAELRYLPQTMAKLTSDEDRKYMQKLVDLLEENDDIQNVYHNWEE